MKNWLVCTLLFLVSHAFGQPGFNETYGFDKQLGSNIFVNVLLDGNTLVMYGSATPYASPARQGLHFVKIDTSGQVLLQKFYPDPDGDEFAANANFDIVQTSDRGYALTGAALNSGFGVFVKLSQQGEIEFYKKYNPAPNLQYQPRKVLEVDGGYLLSGIKSMKDYDIQIFLMKVDKKGNFLWEKTYGEPAIRDGMGSIIKLNNNHYVMGCAKTPVNAPVVWTQSQLIHVDSVGNTVKTYESAKDVQAGIVGLIRMPDGWLYGTGEYKKFGPSDGDWGMRTKVVRTKESISEIVWERYMSPTTIRGNAPVDIKPTPDGHWVVVGQWITLHPPPPYFGPNYRGGATLKFTSEGDSLWSRLDTAFWSPRCGSTNYLGGVVVLPSGSIIAAGYAESYCFNPERSYGWVLKMSKDGCVNTLCTTTSAGVIQPYEPINLFPNPTTGMLYIDGCENCTAEVYDLLGRQMHRQSNMQQPVDVSFLINGQYVMKIYKGDKVVKIAKFIKYH